MKILQEIKTAIYTAWPILILTAFVIGLLGFLCFCGKYIHETGAIR